MINFLLKKEKILYKKKKEDIDTNLEYLNTLYQLIIKETQNMLRYKQNRKNRKEIDKFF